MNETYLLHSRGERIHMIKVFRSFTNREDAAKSYLNDRNYFLKGL